MEPEHLSEKLCQQIYWVIWTTTLIFLAGSYYKENLKLIQLTQFLLLVRNMLFFLDLDNKRIKLEMYLLAM